MTLEDVENKTSATAAAGRQLWPVDRRTHEAAALPAGQKVSAGGDAYRRGELGDG